MKKTFLISVLVLVSSVCFVSCDLIFGCRFPIEKIEYYENFDREEFDSKLSEWNSSNLKNYEFTYKIAAYTSFVFGGRAIYPRFYEIKVTVKNGSGSYEFTDAEDNKFIEESEQNGTSKKIFKGIEDAFSYVLAIENTEDKETHFQSLDFSIEYDEKYGYPKKFTLVPVYLNETTEDGDVVIDRYQDPSFEITSFKILEE